ncbi:hypothetical protein AAE021_05905 [Arthrobacter citreus]|uniref:Cell wall-binding repeat-containing protein n=1 Tax=Arthrobacter citreus TaxID=1670 RepID=A0ABZ2ZY18_9MICC
MSLSSDDAARGVFDGGAATASLAASSAFFTSSPSAVVLAPPAAPSQAPAAPAEPAPAASTAAAPEGPALTGQAAAAAAGLGIPLLVAEPGSEQLVADELDRLGAASVITYGAPASGWTPAVGDRTQVPGPSDAAGFASVLGLETEAADGEAASTEPAAEETLVAQVAAMAQGERLAVPGLQAPATSASNSASPSNSSPPSSSASSPDTASPSETAGELPDFAPAPRPSDAVVLTTADPASAAAVATARAAGAEVHLVGTADPRADSATIALLRSHRGDAIYAVGEAFGGAENFTAQTAVALDAPELPGGGQTVFPGRRMIALYGHPSGPSLGVLGEQGPAEAVRRAQETAAQYQPHSEEPVIPALEIITTVASSEAGDDGNYSAETPVEELRPWVEAAGEAGVYVVLDLQPGLSTFLDQAVRYEELLRLPHVGLALDSEWRIEPGQRHLEQIGSVDAAEVNDVSAWLASLTRTNVLPQKVFMLHQFNLSMIRNREQLNVSHPELAVSLHADGHGTTGQKLDTWNVLRNGLQPEIWPGWKNFHDEDTPMLTPEQTFTQVSPKPWFVSYQ